MAKIKFTALEKYELIQDFLQSSQSKEAQAIFVKNF